MSCRTAGQFGMAPRPIMAFLEMAVGASVTRRGGNARGSTRRRHFGGLRSP